MMPTPLRSAAAIALTLLVWGGDRALAQEDYRTTLAFESRQLSGWGGGPAATLSQDSLVVHGGRYAGRIDRDPETDGSFSTFTLSIPVTFSGKTLELRGWLRTENVAGFAGLWMREDGATGVLQFDNMQSRNLSGTTEWTEYRVSLPLDKRAQAIFIGALLSGDGTVWADDLELLVDGVPTSDAPLLVREPTAVELDTEFDDGSRIDASELSSVQVDNLALLGRVWGFVKYHHPRITAGEVNWDYELLRVLPSVRDAENRLSATDIVSQWLFELGDPAACDPCAKPPATDAHLTPNLGWIRDRGTLGDALTRRLELIYNRRSAEAEQYYVSFVPGVGNPDFSNEAAYENQPLPDAGFRLLALYRFWNIVEYWFPYRDVIGESWTNVLLEFVPRMMNVSTVDEYRLVMIEFSARINDTHANLWRNLDVRPPRGSGELPVVLRFIEGKAVVTGFRDPVLGPATGLQIGDVIESIDGYAIHSLVETWRPFYSASNQAKRLSDMARSLTRGEPGSVRVTGSRTSGAFALTAERAQRDELDQRAGSTHDLPGETFQRLSENVAYLKLSSVVTEDISAYMAKASDAEILVIDIRNYPNEFVVFTLGRRMITEPTEFARFTIGDATNPGTFSWTAPVTLQPLIPHFSGAIVILVDETSLSQAEYTAMAFRSAPNAVVVGSTTAGADGNVSPVPLPGGINSMISGIGVFYPDRTPTQRVGIVPDLEVHPTIDGIRAGRDEVLETGVSYVLGREFNLPPDSGIREQP